MLERYSARKPMAEILRNAAIQVVDSSEPFQFQVGTKRKKMTPEEAEEILREQAPLLRRDYRMLEERFRRGRSRLGNLEDLSEIRSRLTQLEMVNARVEGVNLFSHE